MPNLTIVTGWSPTGFQQYGWRFLETFARYWPKYVRLIAYMEEPVEMPKGECRRRLLSEIPGCMEFLERSNTTLTRGRAPSAKWKEKEIRRGYSYRFDAWKFCRQAFIPYHAAQGLDDYMVWLDADVVTREPIPEGWIESLITDDVVYLGRRKHSDIGFIGCRLPGAMPVLKRFYDYYATDAVFDLPEWHSAYVFDVAREGVGTNLTPGGQGHVWLKSPLYPRLDHLKGEGRKKLGRSQGKRLTPRIARPHLEGI